MQDIVFMINSTWNLNNFYKKIIMKEYVPGYMRNYTEVYSKYLLEGCVTIALITNYLKSLFLASTTDSSYGHLRNNLYYSCISSLKLDLTYFLLDSTISLIAVKGKELKGILTLATCTL
jgi:hypothetical protein